MTSPIKDEDKLLPVTLLCGFLGAGKTTLLKHVLETKHSEESFKCAVIVNDMAALNIDKSLIDQSALVQSDEVIAMQNGCFCCTLQNDLVDQIISLTQKNQFNYMLIEASGVSEPSQIAPLFDLCDDEHDHEEEHKEGPQLGEVARLDTCVTVIDAAEFYNNLESMKIYEEGETFGTIAELLMEQVEYSNVIVLNKEDLVNEEQLQDVMGRISILNPKAKVIRSTQSKVNVKELLATRLYNRADMEEDSVMVSATKVEAAKGVEPKKVEDCCKITLADGKPKCCKSKAQNGQSIDSGLSTLLLGVLPNNNQNPQMTRHEARFGISSFVYRSRRPFHPGRLFDNVLEPFFMTQFYNELEDWESEEAKTDEHIEKQQKAASKKQTKRVQAFGELMRSKGFVWIASTNFILGGWQQAGNVLRVDSEGPWMCEIRDMWKGTPAEEAVLKDLNQENGEEYPYGDRRQELVFIGKNLKHDAIQSVLDKCLLNDEEMEMGPKKWEETMTEVDKIKLSLEPEEEEGEEEEGEEDSGEDDDNEKKDEEEEEEEDGHKAKKLKK